MAWDIVINYKGLICFGETNEWSGSDEIYLVTSVATGDGGVRTEKHPLGGIYEDVNQGASFSAPIAPCWVGRAQDLVLSATLFEHDQGDPEYYKDAINTIVVGVAVGLTAVGGGAFAWAVPLAGALAKEVLGAGDDNLGTIVLPFTEPQIATHVFTPGAEERGIRHDFFTMHQGQTSTYKAYFDVQINL